VSDPENWRLDGRVCVVTGATAGIGLYGTIEIAKLGAEVAIVGRNARRVLRAQRTIEERVRGARTHGFTADLSSMAAVRSLAGDIRQRLPKLHVLLNNAGVFMRERDQTVDGLEATFAINHLAPFLLTNLLIDHLAASAPSRVVVVASQVERSGSIDFDDLQATRGYDGQRAYRQSKLANILFARELATRVASRGISVVSLHPGVYTTRLLDNLEGWSRIITLLRDRGLPGPSAGGPVLARAAAAPELSNIPGGVYLKEHTVTEPSEQARNAELGRRLWDVSAKLVGL